MVEGLCRSERGGRAPDLGGVGVERELGLLLGAGAGALRAAGGAWAAGREARAASSAGLAFEDGEVGGGLDAGGAGAGDGGLAGAHGLLDLGHDAVLGGALHLGAEAGRRRWRGRGRDCGLGAAGARLGGQVAGGAGAAGGAGHGAAGQAVGAGVEDDRALGEVAQEAARLGPGDAEGVGGAGDEGDGERGRDDAERLGGLHRDDGEERAEGGVAEEAAEAVVVHPRGERDVGRREGGGDEEGYRRDDGAGEDAGLAGVEEEAGAPGGERDGMP